MDKKQFYHEIHSHNRFTAVVEVPTKEEMAQIISLNLFHETVVKIKCGLSIVNPKDTHFLKKLGRELSTSRLKEQEFRLSKVVNGFFSKKTRIEFICVEGSDTIARLVFESSINRKKIYLVDVVLNCYKF